MYGTFLPAQLIHFQQGLQVEHRIYLLHHQLRYWTQEPFQLEVYFFSQTKNLGYSYSLKAAFLELC